MMTRIWMAIGALAACGAVALSALRAHALPARLDAAALAMVDSALTMQFWHAVALLLAGLISLRAGWLAHLAGACFALGMALFCGTIYAGVFAGLRLGPLAPIGGSLMMLGWIMLALAAFARPVRP